MRCPQLLRSAVERCSAVSAELASIRFGNTECTAVSGMTEVTFAHLMIHQVRLSPREAASLTLATAREADRWRAIHGVVGVPDPGKIVLRHDGTVAFTTAPRDHAVDESAALSSLMWRLLGVAEERRTALHAWDAATVAADGFRMVLERFADP